MEYQIFIFGTPKIKKKKFCDTVENRLILIKEYGPYGPQGPWAHKTKMFLLSSYYVVIIILIMMIQGQGQGPGPGPTKDAVQGLGPAQRLFWVLALAPGPWPWPWIIMIRMMITT